MKAARRARGLPPLVLAAALTAGMGGGTAVSVLAVPLASGHLLPSPLVFLRADAGFTAADLGAIEQGRVVARVIDTGDPSEVMAVGAVRLRTTAARMLAQLQSFEGRRRPSDILQAGFLGREPTAGDLAGLTLDPGDVSGLARCRPGDCDVRLSAEAIQRFRREVDWSSPRRAESANNLWREVLAGLAADYLARGNGALFQYDNNDMPVKVADSLARVLERSGYLAQNVPDLHRYLLRFPQGRPPDVQEYLYWVKEKFWIKTVATLNHVVIMTGEGAGGRYVLAASKQIYASRYYESSVALTVFVEGPAGTDLVYISRSRADIRPSGFNFLERLLLRRLVGGRLDAQLRWVRDEVQGTGKASAHADGEHGDGPALDPLHREGHRLSFALGPEHVQEGKVVVGGGGGQ